MDYGSLSASDFDAIVTGELTHQAIWMEDALVEFIARFLALPTRRVLFERVLLRRDGLTFQDKIEIVRALLNEFDDRKTAQAVRQLLTDVEAFKALRNAFAHGLDVTPDSTPAESGIRVEVVTRSGKEKTLVVTPETHAKTMTQADALRDALEKALRLLVP